MKVIGWTSLYTSGYETEQFTDEHKKALIECIKKRHYNFNHFDYEYIEYCTPFYDTKKICSLTKTQFDEVMNLAYAEMPRGKRLLPVDTIKREPINEVLYEKKEYEPKGDNDNV